MNRPILNYHAIGTTSSPSFAPWTVPASEFAAQLDLLVEHGLRGVSVAESLDEPGPDQVALTFDDGYEDFVTVAVPELEKRGFVLDGNYRNRGELYLGHRHNGVDLDIKYAQETL